MKFLRRAAGTLAGLVMAVTTLVAVSPAPAAQAVSYCGFSGTLGAPRIVNVGVHNPITVWSSSGYRHKVYVNHPQYFCPAKVHTDWGYTMYVECLYLQPFEWFSTWGNHSLKYTCSWADKNTVWFQELHH